MKLTENGGPTFDLDKCARCGMCLAACPVYRETLVETASPRARLALVRALADHNITDDKGYQGVIYNCTSCMACAAVCPSGVNPSELILKARSEVKHKPLPLQKFVLNQVLSFPGRFRKLSLPLLLYEKSGVRWLLSRLRRAHWLPKPASGLAAMLPEQHGGLLYKGETLIFTPHSQAERRVGYFIGCAQNLVFTSVAMATVRVLLKNQCEVVIPQGITCCGMPHIGYGEQDKAKELARQNIEAFEKTEVSCIVTDCATCGATLKDYGRLLAEDPKYASRAAALAGKVRDITEFLVNDITLNTHLGKLPYRVTYHDSCHLGRGQGIYDAPRTLLKIIAGENYVEMDEADVCCGGAGSYTLTHHDVSMKILDRKMNNVAKTGAVVISTACPGCQVQLAQGVERQVAPLKIKHIVELLDEAYKYFEENSV